MPKRRHICDVPGCINPRKTWQRLCTRCFDGLPWAIRNRIISNFRTDKRAWRAAVAEADKHLQLRAGEPAPRTDSRTSYEQIARLLGEH